MQKTTASINNKLQKIEQETLAEIKQRTAKNSTMMKI
jgi:hypothetical protein